MRDPMHDEQFLLALDNDHNKIIYAKLISLTRDEQPIEAIEGVVQSGSINIDGKSAVRRSCNLTMTTKMLNINEVYWGFTTKVKIEIGLQNNVNSQYDKIIWFKQGIFILTEFKTSQQVNNYVITLTGKDKMCLLNGDISGHFTALTTDLGAADYKLSSEIIVKEKIPIKTIIKDMIHHYAQEPWSNIIVNNIEDYGLEILDNSSQNAYYLWRNKKTAKYEYLTKHVLASAENNIIEHLESANYETVDINLNDPNLLILLRSSFTFLNGLEEDANGLVETNLPTTIVFNEDKTRIVNEDELSEEDKQKCHYYNLFKIEPLGPAGYRLTDLVYDKDLIAAGGDTVTSILDKLVNMLGSFEYFYNLDGQFVFQAKDTYINSTWSAAENLDVASGLSYITPSLMQDKTSYYFENGQLTTAIQNNPNLLNIRNDFTVWGKKSQTEVPIHARFAIDKKPLFYMTLDNTNPPLDSDNWKTITEENVHILYATKECQDLLLKMTQLPTATQYRRHPIPEVFGKTEAERNEWWYLQDWADYYKAFVGDYPTDDRVRGQLKYFQAANSIGYSGDLYFTNRIVSSGRSPFQIVDVAYFPETNEYLPTQDVNGWNGFQHRFNSCTHTYRFFMNQMATQNANNQGFIFETYFYQPTFDFDPAASLENNNNENLRIAAQMINMLQQEQRDGYNPIVDWRELIFRMQLDWYHHNHDDNFEQQIALINTPFSKALGILDYYNGKTGYEQYYIDIEGFWRYLYDSRYIGRANDISEHIINDETVIYDITGWNKIVTEDPATLLFWFDFYNADGAIGRFSVPAVGQRTKVVNDDDVRVIVYPDVPDIIYPGIHTTKDILDPPGLDIYNHYKQVIVAVLNEALSENNLEIAYPWFTEDEHESILAHLQANIEVAIGDLTGLDAQNKRDEVIDNIAANRAMELALIDLNESDDLYIEEDHTGYSHIRPIQDFINAMSLSVRKKSAKEVMDNLLYTYSHTNDSITLTTVPIYYLQPNSIIHVHDELSHIDGYYEVNKITLPLAYNGTMSITAIKIPQQIY